MVLELREGDAMTEAIATVSGTAIRPGISRNNRLYTVEAIGRMVERAQQRLDAG
jgi:hypothetical protein